MGTLGGRIKELRQGKSISEFCELFQIHKNTLSYYERDLRKPDAAFLTAFCKHFHVSADWLLLGKELPSSSELDQSLLTEAIEALEFALKEKGRHMEPEQKAEIITEIYMLLSEEEQTSSKATISKIIRLVA